MVGIGMRDFECTLCGQTFKQMSGDMIFPGPEICGDCLQEVWDMEDATHTQHVSVCLEERQREEMIQSMLQHIQWHKEKWASAEEVIQSRAHPFGF